MSETRQRMVIGQRGKGAPQLSRVQEQWKVDVLRKLGWISKTQTQEALTGSLTESLRAREAAIFPRGGAKGLSKGVSSREWKGYLDLLGRVEAQQPPRDLESLTDLANAAQLYLDHSNATHNEQQQQSEPARSRRESCERSLKFVRMQQTFAGLGDSLWDSQKTMRAASLQAQLDLDSVPKGKMEKLEAESGASPSFWINRPGEGGNPGKTFLFKPDSNSTLQGMPEGFETAREALVGRVSDLLNGRLGLDFKVPETHVIEVDKDKFPEGSLRRTPFDGQTGPVRGSVQQFAPNDGQLGNQPGSQRRKIPPESCQKLAILDVITLNMDRHPGNLLVNANNGGTPEIVPIDHGRSFPTKEALEQFEGFVTSNNNVLLNLPGAFEPFSKDMLRKIDDLDPNLMTEAMRQERDSVAQVHPSTRGKVSEQSMKISSRSTMFLKLAARALPPAVLQFALARNSDALLDPDIDDDEFTERAQAVIAGAEQCLDAIKEFFLMTLDERTRMTDVLNQNGWRVSIEAGLSKDWKLGGLRVDRAMKLYKQDVPNRGQSDEDLDQRLSQDLGGLKSVQKSMEYLDEVIDTVLPDDQHARRDIAELRHWITELEDSSDSNVWDAIDALQRSFATLKDTVLDRARDAVTAEARALPKEDEDLLEASVYPNIKSGNLLGALNAIRRMKGRHKDEALTARLQTRGVNDAGSGKALVGTIMQARTELGRDKLQSLNQGMLGGGNLGMEVVFNRPEILSMSETDRNKAFKRDYDRLAKAALKKQLAQLEQRKQEMGRENFRLQKQGIERMFEITQTAVMEFLNQEDNRKMVTDYLGLTKDSGLSFETTMAVVRMESPENIDQVNDAIDKLFSGIPLSDQERLDVSAFLPGRSS